MLLAVNLVIARALGGLESIAFEGTAQTVFQSKLGICRALLVLYFRMI